MATIRFKTEAEARAFGIKIPTDPGKPPPPPAVAPLVPPPRPRYTKADGSWYDIKMAEIRERDRKQAIEDIMTRYEAQRRWWHWNSLSWWRFRRWIWGR